jgi:hypothetical protein
LSRVALLALVAVVGLVTACSSDDRFLPALLADPMATYEAEGLVLFDSWEREEGRNIVTDKPAHAEVGRRYRIQDPVQAEEILARVALFAESEGWRVSPTVSDPPTGFRAAKQLGPGEARLIVSLVAEDPSGGSDPPSVLRLVLDFGFVRIGSTTTSDSASG